MIRSGRTIAPKYQKASVVFIDIRGFSRFSGKMSARDMSDLLSSNFFYPLDNIIHEYNGTLDKHIGDGIMGVYGAPVAAGDDTVRAVLSALRMKEEMARINRNVEERERRIAIGIGISTGEIMAGIFGSNRKKEYTVYGQTVNLAARLERLAQAGEILICPDTFKDVSDLVRTEQVGRLTVKGIEKEITIHKVIEKL
jgi:adenylate cyclase